MNRWQIGGGLTFVLLVGVAGVWWNHRAERPAARPPSGELPVRWPPLAKKVQVEVLNGSGLANLARVATVRLRDAGLDVVFFGGADSTTVRDGKVHVLVRGVDTTGLGRILEVLQTGDVSYQPAANRWVAFSIILGGPLPPPKGQP